MMVNTVSRTENLWLTSLIRKGNGLSIDGAAASINSVANFITQLKRSGYSKKIKIKKSKKEEKNTPTQTLIFKMTGKMAPPQPPQTAPPKQARPASGSPPQQTAAPAKKG